MFNPNNLIDIETLRAEIEGELYSPTDPEWDIARGAWNLAVDQHPDLVAMPAGSEDIVRLVLAARDAGLRVSVQGTGHNAIAYPNLDRTLLIRTHLMREVTIDPGTRIARVEAGAIWADVVGPATDLGLLALQGSSHDVGVVGYSLGGGVSFLARKHGLAAERVRAIEIVTADGLLRRVDANSDPELFWALRGGGGNFGVVTAIEIELLDRSELYAGTLFFEFERASEVLQAWRRWTATVPEEMTSVGRLLQFPPLPDLPEHLSGKSFVVVEAFWLGEEQEGRELLAPLRALGPQIDTVEMIDGRALLEVHMDPPEPVPGLADHMMLGELTEEAIEALVATTGPGSESPLLSVELRHAGGALGRREPDSGALGRIKGEFMGFAVAILPDPALEPAIRAAFAKLREALASVDAGSHYLNFTEEPVEIDTIYGVAALERLRNIKARYDAEGVFRGNHPIEAAD